MNFQMSSTNLNAHTKKGLETYRMHLVHTTALSGQFGLVGGYGISTIEG